VHILVTGGAGFIGSNLCAMLASRGHLVTAIDAFRPQEHSGAHTAATLRYRNTKLLDGINVIHADMADKAQLHAILAAAKPDCVVHLAGQAIVSVAERDPEAANADILQTTINLFETVRDIPGCRRVVHISSSMVYGNYAGASVDETAPTAPISVYGGLKLATEAVARTYLANTGVESVIVRPTAVYGPGEVSRRVVQTFCENAIAGAPVVINGSTHELLDFTYVADLCDGLLRAATVPAAAGETFNITGGQSRSLGDLVACIRAHFPALDASVTDRRDHFRPQRGGLDIGKAKRLLGYAPAATLETGIARYLAHLRGRQTLPDSALPDSALAEITLQTAR